MTNLKGFFTREPGPSYVSAFAARLVLGIGQGIVRSRSDIQRVLMAEDIEALWTLAMLLVQWYEGMLPPQEANVVATALQEFAMAPLTANLNLFRERLLPFVRTAHQAQNDAQLAAAGVYFAAAVEEIGINTLSSAIQSGPVTGLRNRIQARLPLPAGLQEEYKRVLGMKPNAPIPARQSPSRVDQFDRADYSVTPSQKTSQSIGAALKPPTPRLAAADVSRAYLHTLGWEGQDVDRLLAGPKRKRNA